MTSKKKPVKQEPAKDEKKQTPKTPKTSKKKGR